jgi:hypothetical protein
MNDFAGSGRPGVLVAFFSADDIVDGFSAIFYMELFIDVKAVPFYCIKTYF